MNETKLFTQEKANQMLPLVKRVVDDILRLGKEIRTISTEVGSSAEEDPRIVRLMEQLEELFEELEGLGCSYKDWNFTVGLVDFPAVVDGEEVFLCWRSDEPEVSYYHGAEEGFAGRKPL